MKPSCAGTLAATAMLAALAFTTGYDVEAAQPAAASDGSAPEEFIVTAKALEDLRLKIKLAENEVYARFNDINSDDSHDIHCYDRVVPGSHVPKRLCVSNAWRTADADVADALVRGMQSTSGSASLTGQGALPGNTATVLASGGSYGSIPGKFRANQLRTERLVINELSELANKDPALGDAMLRVGQAYQTLDTATGSRREWTLYRDVEPGEDGLPFGAKRVVEVRVGDVAWNHALMSHTFTIGSVTGRIRDLRVRCDKSDKKVAYREDVDWTLPDSWSDCTLAVNAKRGTMFALYEF